MADGQCTSIFSHHRVAYRLPPVHQVVTLALDGVVTFDLSCATQIFEHPNANGPSPYRVTISGPRRRVRTSNGLELGVDARLDALEGADTVVLPGYHPFHAPPSAAVLRALRDAHTRGARMLSICVGAFGLAHAGLLHGHRATTHWAAAADLARFPGITVEPDLLYVDQGRILTSAGLAAGLDLCLHIVRRDHGAALAAEIARWNVVAPHREGGQAQFAPAPVPDTPDDGLGATCAWALERLDQPLDLTTLAAHARCSERTLNRRFRDEFGTSPKRWLLTQRLHRARELLETTQLPIEQIASRAGFPTAAALRAHFTRELQTTPSSYRHRFAAASAST